MAQDELCMRITQQIMEYEGDAELLDPPLYEAIDTDALEHLLQSTTPCAGESNCVVSFTYCDYTVVVDNEGTVKVTRHGFGPVPSHQPVQEISN